MIRFVDLAGGSAGGGTSEKQKARLGFGVGLDGSVYLFCVNTGRDLRASLSSSRSMPACVRTHRFNGGRHRRTFGREIHYDGKPTGRPKRGKPNFFADQISQLVYVPLFRPSNDFAISKGELEITLNGFCENAVPGGFVPAAAKGIEVEVGMGGRLRMRFS